MLPNNEFRAHWRSSPGLIPAIVIIGIGTVLLLSNLHIPYMENWWRYWPVLVIAAGLAKFLDTDHQNGRTVGALIAGAGCLLLLHTMNLIELTWEAFWPAVLIGIGVLMLVNRISGPQMILARRGPDRPLPEGTFQATAIFSGFKRKITEGNFRGAHLTAIFGGGELNLRQAGMEGDSAVVYASAIFGGIEIKVPDNWLVTSDGTGIFGGFSDSTEHPSAGPGVKRLIIKGEAVFGGVEVKN
jgi:hypothetical protein